MPAGMFGSSTLENDHDYDDSVDHDDDYHVNDANYDGNGNHDDH